MRFVFGFLSFFICFLFLLSAYPSKVAAENLGLPKKSGFEIESKKIDAFTEKLLSENSSDFIIAADDETFKENDKIIFENNVNANFQPPLNKGPAYLDYPIMTKIDQSLLNRMLPDSYSVFNMPSRDKSPIHKYNESIEMNKNGFDEDSDFVSNAIFDFILGMVTKNMFTMNFNFLAMKDNPGSLNMTLALRPLKNFILKYSRTEDEVLQKSVFELKVLGDNNRNFIFKTSEDGRSTSTGVEFEMKF